MVNTEATGAERRLALSYAPAARRAGLEALLTLDGTLAQLLRGSGQSMVAQMRLTWWHTALTALDTAPAPRQPALEALAAQVLPRGVTGAALAGMVDGWEALLDPEPLDAERLDLYARERGGALFRAGAAVLGAAAGDPVEAAGRGWALADLAGHLGTPAEAAMARDAARQLLAEAGAARWSRAGRALGALAHLARMDLAEPPVPPGAPRRVARLLMHRLTGR